MTPTLNERTDALLSGKTNPRFYLGEALGLLREWRATMGQRQQYLISASGTPEEMAAQLHNELQNLDLPSPKSEAAPADGGNTPTGDDIWTEWYMVRAVDMTHDVPPMKVAAMIRIGDILARIVRDAEHTAPAPASRSGEAQSVEPQTDWRKTELDIARADGWREAVIAAREGARLIPPDGKDGLHNFAAQTVLKAVEAGARAAGVRFADDPAGAMARILERMAEAPSATGVLVERADLQALWRALNTPSARQEQSATTSGLSSSGAEGGPASKESPSTNTVANPAGADDPGEHGPSKGDHGDDPTLSGSHGPYPTPLDEGWAQINALGGTAAGSDLYGRGYIRAIDEALAILTRLGATDAAWRK